VTDKTAFIGKIKITYDNISLIKNFNNNKQLNSKITV